MNTRTPITTRVIARLLFPLLLATVLWAAYTFFSPKVPVQYWDEIIYVSKTYFAQYYVAGDFDNEIWLTHQAWDQPKLPLYLFGIRLYPEYLKEKYRHEQPFDYTRFLIYSGLDFSQRALPEHMAYRNTRPAVPFRETASGNLEDYVRQYPYGIITPLRLVYYARDISALALILAVLAGYYLMYAYAGFVPAVLFALLYAFNQQTVLIGLKAQSEPIFLATFNGALLFLFHYYRSHRIRFLFLFALVSGLCISTKLNGLMLLIMFFLLQMVQAVRRNGDPIPLFLRTATAAGITVMVVVLLEPFLHHAPVAHLRELLQHRERIALYQAAQNPQDAVTNPLVAGGEILMKFVSPDQIPVMNGLFWLNSISFSRWFILLVLACTATGCIETLGRIRAGHRPTYLLLVFFAVTWGVMSYYLVLDWYRYYIQIAPFFLGIQVIGLLAIIRRIGKILDRHGTLRSYIRDTQPQRRPHQPKPSRSRST